MVSILEIYRVVFIYSTARNMGHLKQVCKAEVVLFQYHNSAVYFNFHLSAQIDL